MRRDLEQCVEPGDNPLYYPSISVPGASPAAGELLVSAWLIGAAVGAYTSRLRRGCGGLARLAAQAERAWVGE